MSNLKGTFKRHPFHGAPERFDVVANYVFETFGHKIKYIADVAGGKGMLSRLLFKKYNYDVEVIDPDSKVLTGLKSRKERFKAEMSDYYDLIIALHPDEATTEAVYASKIKPTLLIPCCNFWEPTRRLDTNELLDSIENYYRENDVWSERVDFRFKSIKNTGFITFPPGFGNDSED